MGTKLNDALSWAARGFRVFPLREDSKLPIHEKFYDIATTDTATITGWWRDELTGIERGHNIGVDTSALLVVDIDNKHGKNGQAHYEAIGGRFDTLTVRTPSGGYHLYYNPAGDVFANSQGNNGGIAPDVDTRGWHGYVVGPGSTINGAAYEVLFDAPVAFVPDVVRPKLRAPEVRTERVAAAELDTPSAVAAARLFLEGHPHAVLRMGSNAHTYQTICEVRDRGVSEATAWELLLEDWNERCEPPWPADKLKVMVEHAYRYAQRGEGEKSPEAYFGGVTLIEPPAVQKPARRLRLLSPDDCENAPARKYVIKGMLAEGDVACIYGQPGAGKSVLAPHLAYAVAQGQTVFGKRTRQGKVLYVPAEDLTGMKQRVRVLRQKHGAAPDFLVAEGVGGLTDPEARDELISLVDEERPALVIIDTLAVAFPGIDENGSRDMGYVVAVARRLAETGAAVILVHHDTKDAGGTPRGHSIFNGALDMSLLVERKQGGIVGGRLTKNRNGGIEAPIAFRIDPARLGVDEDGDPITAPVAFEMDAALVRPGKKLSASQSAALDELRTLAQADKSGEAPDGSGSRAVELDAWRRAVTASLAVSGTEKANARRAVASRVVKDLVAMGVVATNSDLVWLKESNPSSAAAQARALKDFANVEVPSGGWSK